MLCSGRYLSFISCRSKAVKQKVSILNKVTPVDGTIPKKRASCHCLCKHSELSQKKVAQISRNE